MSNKEKIKNIQNRMLNTMELFNQINLNDVEENERNSIESSKESLLENIEIIRVIIDGYSVDECIDYLESTMLNDYINKSEEYINNLENGLLSYLEACV